VRGDLGRVGRADLVGLRVVAGQGEEDVVEGGPADAGVEDLDPRVAERPERLD